MERTVLLMGSMGALRQRQQSRMTSRDSGRGILGWVGMLAKVKLSSHWPG